MGVDGVIAIGAVRSAANGLEVVIAARNGDRAAFCALVEQHWARLVRLARSVVGDLEAEDAVQDGLVAAWHGIASLGDPSRFDAWLTRIVFRRCLRRARRLRRAAPLDAAPEQAYNPDPANGIAVEEVLSRLAPRQCAVLHLTVVEGMTDREIAGVLGITAGSVRAHRRRARERVALIVKGVKV